MLKAVVFDMDGVLFDSMPYHADAWAAAFTDVGIKITREDIYKIEGSNNIGIIKLIFEKAGRTPGSEDFSRLSEKKKEIFLKINRVKVFDGIYECIGLLKDKCRLGVVSGSDKSVVEKLIEQCFPDTFDILVTGNDIKEGKPSPGPYLKAIEMLKVRKDECVVVENAPLGVESAKRAGLYCIAIPTYVDPAMLKMADIILPDHTMLKEFLKNLITSKDY